MRKPDYKQVARTIVDLFRRHYYTAIKQKEFEAVKEVLEDRCSGVRNNSQFMRLAIDALSEFKDCHIKFFDGAGNRHNVYHRNSPVNYDLNTAKGYLKRVRSNGNITVGRIDDFAYAFIGSFSDRFKDTFNILVEEAKKYQGNKFIVDLRANVGGNSLPGKEIAQFLLGNSGNGEPRLSFHTRLRTSETRQFDFGPFIPEYLLSHPRLVHRLAGEVIVLTGRNTCSAAESTTLYLAAIPGTLMIGDVTYGGFGYARTYLLDGEHAGEVEARKRPIRMGARFAVNIPYSLGYTADRRLIEGRGIVPHILIPSEGSVVNGRDLVLEKAIEVHKKGYIV